MNIKTALSGPAQDPVLLVAAELEKINETLNALNTNLMILIGMVDRGKLRDLVE